MSALVTSPSIMQGRRILLVEDDPHSRWVLCALMRRRGFNCLAAADGLEGLELVEEFQPELVLMDVMMPGLDGLEATRRLKANPRTHDIPVVVLTGNATPSSFLAAAQAGCDECLAKPIVLTDLLDRLERLLPAE